MFNRGSQPKPSRLPLFSLGEHGKVLMKYVTLLTSMRAFGRCGCFVLGFGRCKKCGTKIGSGIGKPEFLEETHLMLVFLDAEPPFRGM